MIEESNIVFDLLMMDADRVNNFRRQDLDLYYLDKDGDYKPIGEAYNADVESLMFQLFKKKKTRYVISFVDTIDVQNELNPSVLRVLRFLVKEMSYGNILKRYGIRDIQDYTSVNTHYITKAFAELGKRDIVRYTVDKGRRTYMVNPIYFYKGSLKKLFYSMKEYDKFPKTNPLK